MNDVTLERNAHPDLSTQPLLGSRVYGAPLLTVYDAYVLGFSNSLVWRCPSRRMLELYNRHISADHLEIGVGTGYFLARCTFPAAQPQITLVDLNPNTLQHTRQRIAQYAPAASVANVLEPLPFAPASFDSIGLNYVLHCLTATMAAKAEMLSMLARLLRPGGVLFGSTILGAGVSHSALAPVFLNVYNRIAAFTNRDDRPEALEQALSRHFRTYELQIVGSVALFAAWV
jgi:ubiquinone/menaquinone biosynthesis C-methylase UbiE